MSKCDAWATTFICAAAMVLFGTITFSCADERRQIVRAIEAGADPIAARCGVKGSENSACTTYALLERYNP